MVHSHFFACIYISVRYNGFMTPQEYMALPLSKRKTQEEIAAFAKCKQSHVCRAFRKKVVPSLQLAAKFSKATDGAVPIEEFLP